MFWVEFTSWLLEVNLLLPELGDLTVIAVEDQTDPLDGPFEVQNVGI